MADTETKIEKLERVKLKVKDKKVLDLIKDRDDDTVLPSYPSAQLWYSLAQETKEALKTAVETLGYSWVDYEYEMKQHWPQRKKNVGYYTTFN